MWVIDGVVQPYAWGDKDFIPQLRGRMPDGEPQAELWFGTHPDAPSPVVGGGLLSDHIELPFLVKVLAAAQPLSIQAHPDAQGAVAGFAAEQAAGIPRDSPQRNYRDEAHKPELICALTPFRAAVGFEDTAVIDARLAVLDPEVFDPLRQRLDDDGPRGATQWILRYADDLAVPVEAVRRAIEHRPDPILEPLAAALRAADHTFGVDRGLLMLLLMRHVRLGVGDAVFLPARRLHAYIGGAGVEVMANSNNVIRGGLTAKHVDVDELERTTIFEPGGIEPEPGNGQPRQQYRVPVSDFAVQRLEVDGEIAIPPAADGPAVLLSTGGVLAVGDREIAPGQAVCFTSVDGAMTLAGAGTAWLVTTGSSGPAAAPGC